MNIPARLMKQSQFFLSLAFLFLALASQETCAQHSLALHTNYTSSSRIFPTPFSSNPIFQSTSYEIGSALSFSAQYRYAIAENFRLGFSFEYLPNEFSERDANGTEYIDGYKLFLSELSGYFTLPVGSTAFQLYVGGGVGMYMGAREYTIASVEAISNATPPAFGIHVLSGFEYYPVRSLSLRAEFLFRDPQIVTENQFSTESIVSNGVEYRVGSKPFKSKVNINGNVYSLGVAFHF